MEGLCDYSFVRWKNGFATFEQATNPSGFEPYEHQVEVWKEMDNYFKKSRYGILWVPTGGGKTVIAAKWLLEERIDKGYKVIWFAHMGILLKQAAETFRAVLQKYPALKGKRSIRCALVLSRNVGGTGWREVAKDSCDVVFASPFSSARYMNDIASFVKTAEKGVFVVVDEVQHAYAPTYRKILENLRQMEKVFFLGMSATPYRMAKDESVGLWKLFDAYDQKSGKMKVIARVRQETLIEKNILAKPQFHDRHTEIEPEVPGDEQLLDRFHELSSAALQSLSENEARNRLICEEYLRNYREKKDIDIERYGKTLIFTPTIEGNRRLYEVFTRMLRENGYHNVIRVAYIDSTVPESERARIIEKFRTPWSKNSHDSIDILINVEMCTEGFDAPLTRTVFLARPTSSDSLVRQMIGRAMRGPRAGGNAVCHVVRFVDRLPEGYDLIDPEQVIEEERREEPPFSLVPREVLKVFRTAVQSLAGRVSSLLPFRFSYIPIGWYYLQPDSARSDGNYGEGREDDEAGIDGVYIAVLPHQKRGFSRLFSSIAHNGPEIFRERKYGDLVRNYFYDCPDPLPDEDTLKEFIAAFPSKKKSRAFASEEEIFVQFKDRSAISPWALAREDGCSPPDASRFYEKYPFLKEFYPRDAELLHDIALCGLYRTLDERTPPGIDPGKCEEFVKASIHEERVIPMKEILDDLAKESPDIARLPGAALVSPVEFRWDKEGLPPAPLGFCRFSDGKVELHLADVLQKKAVPRAVREYAISHLLAHAAAPYAHYGPVHSARERQFRPTRTAARQFLSLPVWEDREVVAEDGAWARVCRAYLTLVLRVAMEVETPILDEFL
ncbi:MAG: DEAD/DEAH box helicase family protein [Methanolinea sp.]|nr:DEAD/DEAH box helicase family protein [Methanolinea sp.]